MDYNRTNKLFEETWKVIVPQRLRAFMWLIINNALPTNSARWKRNMRFDELVLHVLRDCLVTKNMWKSIVPGSNHISFFPNSLDTWVFENILARARFAQGLA